MKYHLKNIEFIGEAIIEKLKSIDIYNTDDLLEAASTEIKRKTLQVETEISMRELEYIASVSDLVRIKGVATKTASILINTCNFSNVQEIAQYHILNKHSEKDATFSKLKEKLDKSSISMSKFLEIAEEAAELKPRLVFEDNSITQKIDDKFSCEIKKQNITYGKWQMKSSIFTFAMLFIAALIIVSIFSYPIYFNYKELNTLYQKSFGVELFMPAFWLLIFNLLGDIIIVLTIMVLFLIIADITQKRFKLFIYRILFRRAIFKEIYLQLDYKNLIKKHKKSSRSMVILVSFFIVSVIVILAIKGFEGIHDLKFPIIIFLVFLVSILYFNTFKFYNKIKEIRKSIKEVYQRIQFVTQIEVLYSIFVLIIGLNVIFPITLEAVQFFENEIVIKTSEKKYQEAIQKLDSIKLEPDKIERTKELIEKKFILESTFNLA